MEGGVQDPIERKFPLAAELLLDILALVVNYWSRARAESPGSVHMPTTEGNKGNVLDRL